MPLLTKIQNVIALLHHLLENVSFDTIRSYVECGPIMNEHYQIIDLLSSAIVFTYPSWLFADKRRLEELKENILTQMDVLNTHS